MKLIHVTADDIEMGKRDDPKCCPIALAVKRAFGVEQVSVGETEVEVNSTDFILPERAQSFIEHFDLGNPVDPFVFELGDLC